MKISIIIFLIFVIYLNKSFGQLPLIDDIQYTFGTATIVGSFFNSINNVSVTKLGSSNATILEIRANSKNETSFQVDIVESLVFYGTIEVCRDNSSCGHHEWNPVAIEIITSIPTQGGSISIAGYYLSGLPQSNNTLTFSKNLLTLNPQFNNDSLIVFQPLNNNQPKLSGSNVSITLQIRGTTLKKSFAFQSPIIDTIDYTNSIFQINGNSFGGDVSLLSLTIDDIPLNITKFTAHYNISCSIKDNPYLTNILSISGIKKINLSVNNNPTSYKYINRPIISSLTAISKDGGLLTLYGELFSSLRLNNKTTVVSVTIGNGTIPVKSVAIVNSTMITLRVPPKNITSPPANNLEVIVTIDGASSMVQTNTLFSYDAPILKSAKQSKDGESFTIIAKNLIQPATGVGLLLVYFDEQSSFRPDNTTFDQNTNETTIYFATDSIPYTIPSGKFKKVYITENGIISNYVTVEILPTVLSSTHAPVVGGIITLMGRFWTSDTPQQSIKVTIGNKACPLSSPPYPAALRCFMPSGTGGNHSIQITLNNTLVERPDNYKFQYQDPVIVYISDITSRGGTVTLVGANFDNPLNISLGNQTCDQSILVNNTVVLCEISEDKLSQLEPDTMLPADVTVNGLSETALLFKFSKHIGFNLILIIPIIIVIFSIISLGVFIYVKRRKPKKISIMQIQLSLLRPYNFKNDDLEFEERWNNEQMNMLIREGIPRDEAKAYMDWFKDNKDK